MKKYFVIGALLVSAITAFTGSAFAGLKEANALGIQENPQSIDRKLTHNVLVIYLFPSADRIQLDKSEPGMSGAIEIPHSGNSYRVGFCPRSNLGEFKPCKGSKSFDDLASALNYLFALCRKAAATTGTKLVPSWWPIDFNRNDPNDR
jgi:hypothetical protein